ncbi:uncharacterized protein LTR77_002749 [Saxophila tyrrhenica]|uniref:Uncharacterized protein n=1 Tax=Saxophila tyrrhenica TaxID=1690608 RepID=A0AAV9PFV1_9PEZI|nr:hypothetical protein LTR77_002749 [Saxophila tyrrhenica]
MTPSRGLGSIPACAARHKFCSRAVRQHSRPFTAFAPLQSGHNRWSKIKHDKGVADARKNRQRSAFAQEITTASKLFGPEPSMNPRLADLVTKAKREGFAKASIEAAIARGQGKSTSGANLESVMVEGMLPNNVAVIVECETDSKLKTLADVRLAMKDAGGSATPCSYLFEKRGKVVLEPKEGIDLESALEAALKVDVTDLDEDDEGNIVAYCGASDTKAVGEGMSAALGTVIKTSDIVWSPNLETQVALSSENQVAELGSFVDNLLDKENSVQAVSMNVAQGSASEGPWKELQSRLSACCA